MENRDNRSLELLSRIRQSDGVDRIEVRKQVVLILLAKLSLGVLGGLLLTAVVNRVRFASLSDSSFSVAAVSYLAVTRLGLFLFLFLILAIPAQSDVASAYYPQANSVIAGLVPYRDFTSSYAPMFPLICSLVVRLWDSPLSIILLAILFELAAFPLWLQYSRHALGEAQSRLASVMYLTSPLPIVNVVIAGQNQIWIAFFLAMALYLLERGKTFLSGIGLSLSLLTVKFLPIIFAPVVVAASPRRARWLGGFVLAPMLVYGFLLLKGIDVFLPLRMESQDRTSGNLPFLLTIFGNYHASPLLHGLVLAVGGGVSVACFLFIVLKFEVNAKNVGYFLTFTTLIFMLVSQKSYTNYLTIFFFPICLTVAKGANRKFFLILFALFGVVAVLEPSLWFRLLNHQDLTAIRMSHSTLENPTEGQVALFLICEVLLLGFYASYAILAWHSLAQSRLQPRAA